MNLSHVSNPRKARFKGKINYKFKWNQPYLSRGLNLKRRSNSLNSTSERLFHMESIRELVPNIFYSFAFSVTKLIQTLHMY